MLALLFAVLLQDPSVEDLVRSLSADGLETREKATRELAKLPLGRLAEIEKYLAHPDAEAAARVRQAMKAVLASNLGSRKARFELRPIADQQAFDEWKAAGADPMKPPKGFEVRRYHEKAAKPDGREAELVGAVRITERDVQSARGVPDMASSDLKEGGWWVEFELTESGAKEFDKVAKELYGRAPRGRLAILVDDRILTAPSVHTDAFAGRGHIAGDFSEKESNQLALALKGDWMESSMRAEKVKDTVAAVKAADFLRGTKGFEEAAIRPDETGVNISGYLDTKTVDLVSLWQSLRERGYNLVPRK